MQRRLMILEVSQKQAYIFAPRELRKNRERSDQIARVTSEAFFRDACADGSYSHDNMVYSGGGHTVLQFPDEASATAFAKKVSLKALRDYPQMELFIKQVPYDPNETPGQNLCRLTGELEKKKSLRRSSFRTLSMGIEAPDTGTSVAGSKGPTRFHGWELTYDTGLLAGEDNFLAVVHIDGNAMGKRVQKIYNDCQTDWEACVKKLDLFSREIDAHFAEAYDEMVLDLIASLEASNEERWKRRILPIRKLIGAGDDVCFVCAGCLGLECAASFLRHLSAKRNGADREYYSACAGVVLIHTKFPFRKAYDLSEALCSNAKVFAAEHQTDSPISAIDYHIEFGQMKDSLSAIRADYRTEDGGHLGLRPLAVTGSAPAERQYGFLTALIRQMKENKSGLARSKVKALRTAFHQGELESALALRMTRAGELLHRGLEARFPDWLSRTLAGEELERGAFFTDSEGKRRCLYFDAIELADNTLLWSASGKEGTS